MDGCNGTRHGFASLDSIFCRKGRTVLVKYLLVNLFPPKRKVKKDNFIFFTCLFWLSQMVKFSFPTFQTFNIVLRNPKGRRTSTRTCWKTQPWSHEILIPVICVSSFLFH